MPGLMPITNTERFLDAILKRLDAIHRELVARGKPAVKEVFLEEPDRQRPGFQKKPGRRK